MSILPRLSIATKLYAIFALLAIATVALAAGGGRQCAPPQRPDPGIRGGLPGRQACRAPQRPDLRGRDGIARHLHVARRRRCHPLHQRPADVSTSGSATSSRNGAGWCCPPTRTGSTALPRASGNSRNFAASWSRRANEGGIAAAREWGDNEGNRATRSVLNGDLEAFGQVYSHRAKHAYAQIDQGIETTAWIMSAAQPASR